MKRKPKQHDSSVCPGHVVCITIWQGSRIAAGYMYKGYPCKKKVSAGEGPYAFNIFKELNKT